LHPIRASRRRGAVAFRKGAFDIHQFHVRSVSLLSLAATTTMRRAKGRERIGIT
jgi:hypothetical protein